MIQRFRRRQDVVEAMQLTRESGSEAWEWADSKPFYEPDGTVSGLSILTPEGRLKADFGDWVVRSTNGQFFPLSPAVFEASYEPAGASTGDTDG